VGRVGCAGFVYSETRVLEGGTWKVVQYHFSSVPVEDGGCPPETPLQKIRDR
jgi:hypothetical protein